MEQVILTSITLEQLNQFIKEAIQEHISANPTANNNNSSPYYTREEAAKVLHLSYPTFLKVVKNKGIKRYPVGRKKLYRKEDINNIS